jgi:micrococcal nuclease
MRPNKTLINSAIALGLVAVAGGYHFKTKAIAKQLAKVIAVSDGDTLKLDRNGETQTIRLCGIDAPEAPKVRKDGTVSAPGQPLGQEAKEKLQRLVDKAQGEVSIVPVERDRYGRTVAEVFVLGETEQFIQEEMLKAGLAYVYPEYVQQCPNAEAMQKSEAIGQKKRLGVWAGAYQRPWDYRREKRQRNAADGNDQE